MINGISGGKLMCDAHIRNQFVEFEISRKKQHDHGVKSPKWRQTHENSERHRKRLTLVGALGFQNIFLKKTPKTFPPVVSVENFVALYGAIAGNSFRQK